MDLKMTGVEAISRRFDPARLRAAISRGMVALEQDATARVRMRMTGNASKRRKNIRARVAGEQLIIESNDPVIGFLERGTRPHLIVARNAKVLAFDAGGATLFRRVVRHPGTKPVGMFRRTLAEDSNRFVQVFQRAFVNYLTSQG